LALYTEGKQWKIFQAILASIYWKTKTQYTYVYIHTYTYTRT